MVNEETILVRIINKVEGADELVKESNLLSTVKKDNGDLIKVYEEQTNSQRKRVTVTEKATASGERQVKVQKETLAQGPRFKMHYLGIMFGGMALNRAMSNLTATSKEWVGIGELMSTTMGVVMLPATLELLDMAVLPLMEALLGMPEWVQTTVGVTVMGLEGLGKIAEFGGQIALGAGAFSIAFPALATKIGKGLTSALSKNIGKGVVIAVGLTIAWGSIVSLKSAIEEGSLIKEIMSIIGIGTGLGMVGLMLGGPVGGLIGFTLGIGIGLIIDWHIAENRWKKKAEELGVSEEIIGEHALRSTALGSIMMSGKKPSFKFRQQETLVDSILGGDYNYASFAVGGNVSNTGLHFLHEGETVLRKDQAEMQGGNFSVTYNVTVSDKREFEQLLRANNQQLVRDVRRSSQI